MTDPKIDIVSKVVPCWECQGKGERHLPVRGQLNDPEGTMILMGYEDLPCDICNATGLVRIQANFADVPTVRRGIE